MANISRLVNNLCNNNTEARKVFVSIAQKTNKQIDGLGATTPIPNQVFASAYNNFSNFSQLIFLENARKKLDNIRDIDHFCSAHRASINKNHGSIKFVCFGYKDLDGDIVITDISCPIIDSAYAKKFKTNDEFFNYISENTASADFNLESPSLMYEYLRLQTFKDPPIGSAIVGLIGYTKHENSNNCFKLSEVAEAVVPQMPIRADNIMSGVIAITPKTINATKLYSQKNKSIDNSLENGSLECAIIEYQKNPKTNAVQPTNIMNVCRAVEIVNDKAIPIKISSSSQPTDNLYIAKQIQDYVM